MTHRPPLVLETAIVAECHLAQLHLWTEYTCWDWWLAQDEADALRDAVPF